MEPQWRDQCHCGHPQRGRQRARDDAASREPRGSLNGLHRWARAVRGPGATPRPSCLIAFFGALHGCGRRSFATTAGGRSHARARAELAMPIAIILLLIDVTLI